MLQAPGEGKCRSGRIWTYIGDPRHPYIVYDYTPDGVAHNEADALRRQLRQEKAIPVLERIRGWLDHEGKLVLPRSPMARAITHTLNQRDALCGDHGHRSS